ncbi:MAG: glycosyltransferase [Fibrella sp.]|nr:glycosyltransferase [Armatimonadota bacterium]
METRTDPPLISVLVPTRNRAVLVQDTIQSVLAQQWGDFELVISNNHSSDNTREVLDEIAASDKRVRVVSPPETLPMTAHWNWAWSQLRGTYGTLLSDDDIWEPTFLQTVVEAAQAHAEFDVVATNYYYWDDTRPSEVHLRKLTFDIGTGPVANPLEAMLKHNLIFLNCAIMRRDAFVEIGGYGASHVGDYELWIKAAIAEKRFYYIHEPHLKYRIHGAQITDSTRVTQLTAEMLEDYVSQPGIPWKMRERLRRSASGTWALIGKSELTAKQSKEENEARSYFLRGLKVCPWHPANWIGIARTLFPSRA